MQSMSLSSTLLLSPSPSLSCCYSGNNTLADIAARVVHELSLQEEDELEGCVDDAEEFFLRESATRLPQLDEEEEEAEEAEDCDGGDEEFEFAFVSGPPESSPISADEIFHNGQIRPMYEFSPPLINCVLPPRTEISGEKQSRPRRRQPLKLLMSEDDTGAAEPGFSCSSSESDDLEGLSPESYCVWFPPEARGQQCRKSSSAGSGSRRWNLKQLLLNRSNSDGRTDELGRIKAGGDGVRMTAEGHDGRRRRSNLPLPNKKDLVGFFANVNGLSRNLNPFP